MSATLPPTPSRDPQAEVLVDWTNDTALFDKLRAAHNGTGPEVIVTNGRIELLKDWPQ